MTAGPRATVSWWTKFLARGMFVACGLAAGGLSAQDLVRVEEDWELVVATPDSNSAGPQVACTMSPFGNIDGTYFTLEINHQSVPYWAPGGLTLHQWAGESLVQSMNRSDRSVMQTSDERVTWTQALYVHDGDLTFQVKSGASSTWGSFGSSGHFRLRTNWNVDNINGYTPDVSAGRSGVAFASNRVQSLKILRIRGTFSDSSSATDNTVRVVYQNQD